MERFIGGSLTGVLVRLVVLSIIVGIVLAALGLEPFDIFNSIRRLAERLYSMGFEAIEKGVSYFLTGALLVVPIWLIARLFRAGRSKKS